MSAESFDPLFIGMADASADVRADVAGSKAAQLWRMAKLGLDVPPAFVMPATLCAAINADDTNAKTSLDQGLRTGIARLEDATHRRFGDDRSPLLVSVRSGAAKSMPGMLETILDVGLNDQTVHGLIRISGNPRLAWDSYRRFIQGYSEVVYGISGAAFEQSLADMMRREGVEAETDLDPEALERLSRDFAEIAARLAGHAVPDDPMEQLNSAARAVFRSWESPRAREYRRLNKLDNLLGTATTVQCMVFGNAGVKSGAGVAFTRNPATGQNAFYVDFLFDAQGEDVVAGRRTPGNVAQLAGRLPHIATRLHDGAKRLEREFADVQDVEFTVENDKLYFLQTRAAKRTPIAALRIAVDLVHEKLISVETALERLADIDLERVGVTRFADAAKPIATAIPASPGVASGRIAFDSPTAKQLAAAGDAVILVRQETSTEDIAGFAVADGILTAAGGRTAHAAVVARQLGKVCLVGCRTLTLTAASRAGRIGENDIHEGDWLSIDGDIGEITLGKRAIVTERPDGELAEIKRWREGTKREARTERLSTRS